MTSNGLKLLISLGLCQLAGFIGSLFNKPAIKTWYMEIQKPSFTPPNWIFAPVWISLYILMGLSLYLIWTSGINGKIKHWALLLFFIQLILNMLWSYFFFFLRSPFYGLIEIIILLIFIILTILRFYTIRPLAAYLLFPYALWVSFATILNYYLWQLNR